LPFPSRSNIWDGHSAVVDLIGGPGGLLEEWGGVGGSTSQTIVVIGQSVTPEKPARALLGVDRKGLI